MISRIVITLGSMESESSSVTSPSVGLFLIKYELLSNGSVEFVICAEDEFSFSFMILGSISNDDSSIGSNDGDCKKEPVCVSVGKVEVLKSSIVVLRSVVSVREVVVLRSEDPVRDVVVLRSVVSVREVVVLRFIVSPEEEST